MAALRASHLMAVARTMRAAADCLQRQPALYATSRQLAGSAGPSGGSQADEQDEQEEAAAGGGWMPSWMKNRLPSVLGGTKEVDELENLTLDCEMGL